MSNLPLTPARLAQQYLDVWNESDAAKRKRLVDALFAEDATYVDPMMSSEGHDGIDRMIGAAQQQFAGPVDDQGTARRFQMKLQ